MLVKELLEKLTTLPPDMEVRIGFSEQVLEQGIGWQEYDTDSSVSEAVVDLIENTVTLVEDES